MTIEDRLDRLERASLNLADEIGYIECQACRNTLPQHSFSKDKFYCDSCIAANDNSEYCEPCAKLDASLIDAIEQIDETWVCKRCAHAIRFMKEQERIQINIWIRSGKCPF